MDIKEKYDSIIFDHDIFTRMNYLIFPDKTYRISTSFSNASISVT